MKIVIKFENLEELEQFHISSKEMQSEELIVPFVRQALVEIFKVARKRTRLQSEVRQQGAIA